MVTRFGSESAFILRITWPLWAFTVISLVPSSPPTCLFKSPRVSLLRRPTVWEFTCYRPDRMLYELSFISIFQIRKWNAPVNWSAKLCEIRNGNRKKPVQLVPPNTKRQQFSLRTIASEDSQAQRHNEQLIAHTCVLGRI
jgi:hypothetical protein